MKKNDFLTNLNYKNLFLNIQKESYHLEKGALFKSLDAGPIQVNAIAIYNNILATGKQEIKN